MSHENRLAIQSLLVETPGLGGGDIARMLSLVWDDIQGDIAFLSKKNIIRREGYNRQSRWYAIPGAVVVKQMRGPRQYSNGMNYGGKLCEYHRLNPAVKRNGICARCSIIPDAAERKAEAGLKKIFPKIFTASE